MVSHGSRVYGSSQPIVNLILGVDLLSLVQFGSLEDFWKARTQPSSAIQTTCRQPYNTRHKAATSQLQYIKMI